MFDKKSRLPREHFEIELNELLYEDRQTGDFFTNRLGSILFTVLRQRSAMSQRGFWNYVLSYGYECCASARSGDSNIFIVPDGESLVDRQVVNVVNFMEIEKDPFLMLAVMKYENIVPQLWQLGLTLLIRGSLERAASDFRMSFMEVLLRTTACGLVISEARALNASICVAKLQ
jgi:hypothetical protein